jgi:hypothetical protein
LFLLSGLRKTADTIENEAKQTPILNDIMDHQVFGPLIRRGRDEGRMEGGRKIIVRLLAERFGDVPDSVIERLNGMSAADPDRIADRLLSATSVEDVFR